MKNILIVFGGRSAEHEVSVNSARNVLNALDRTLYNPILVGISRSGAWYHFADEAILKTLVAVADGMPSAKLTTLIRHPQQACLTTGHEIETLIHVAFPVLHGPYGEDGTIQGLFEMMGIPYVSCGVLATSLSMDKDLFKKAIATHDIPVVPSITLCEGEVISYEQAIEELSSAKLFIKPACMGSSVGVRSAQTKDEFTAAIAYAFEFGSKVVIEKAIKCRELECAVLGNQDPKASGVGEIKPNHEFYSYEAKYIDPQGAELLIPAQLTSDIVERIKDLSIRAFKIVGGRGMARVDFFLSDSGELYLNEINTIPGFTQISMYPKLWIHEGLTYSQLITTLIHFAQEEYCSRNLINLDPGVAELQSESLVSK